MMATDRQSLKDRLAEAGRMDDDAVDLADAALVLAALSHPGISLDRYRQYLIKTGESVCARYQELLAAGADDNAETRLAALKHILADEQGFTGAEIENYDDLQNADLIRVIDRRKGMPIALAILYIDAARHAGFDVAGLNLPGHFILRLDYGGTRLMFDPFENCRILQAADLRKIIKQHLGPDAELSADYYNRCANRTILLRLQNNIKLRQIEAEDYEDALSTVEAMQLLDPGEFRLLLDAGVLLARTGRHAEAVQALETYIDRAPENSDRHDAALLLQHIRHVMDD